MSDRIDRKRHVDVNNLSTEEADMLSEQIGKKIGHIADKAVEEANSILAIYGLKTKMQLTIEPLETNDKE